VSSRRCGPGCLRHSRCAAPWNAHPAEPHWYLNKLGTAPAARGQGLASALLSAQLCHCDKTGTPAYLEATQHTLIGFYETFGFTCTDPIDVPHGGPRVGGMWRAPH
jgi:GNAT superfamily N-acetyltransferase